MGGGRGPWVLVLKYPRYGRLVGDNELDGRGLTCSSCHRYYAAETVTKDHDGRIRCFALHESKKILNVLLKAQRRDLARPLIAAPIVGHDVKGLETSNESGERATAVETAVNAYNSRLGVGGAPFGYRESLHG